ncbi:MAG TPA: TM0106 family RecB-like putative nuclease, partial [Longimicrobiaceae bacterium]|nr:TM0106 family RecB-like putative nuclease [Longimicrobiaceae bacterium]
MSTVPAALTFSATDLSNFVACAHLALLDRAARLGLPQPPRYDDPALEALRLRGLEHERAYEARLREQGLDVRRQEPPPPAAADAWERRTADTLALMREGAEVIVQGWLANPPWVGRPDFLRRAAAAGGGWRYEVVDTKLARHAKTGALLQILLYADLVATLHGIAPEQVHLALGGPEPRTETFRVADYAAYFRSVRARFAWAAGHAPAEPPRAPDPVEHCAMCPWDVRCTAERREVDHLSFVAGISRRQRVALAERGITTLAELARLQVPLVPPLEGVSAAAFVRVHEQARIQLDGRAAGAPMYELLEAAEGDGLSALPEPSPGDLFFDFESNAYALGHGIQYLFGFVDAGGEYVGWSALTREEEKEVFERFVDFLMQRLERYPGLHVYHFAPYETTALKKLMSFHATRESEVDRLLRGEVFVDLHRVVRRALRASVESYSIKKLEPLYGYRREVPLEAANAALARFDAWLELRLYEDEHAALLESVIGYNRDDCLSTLALRNWLEGLRAEAERNRGAPLPRPLPSSGDAPDAVEEAEAENARRIAALTAGVPANADARSPEQHARWLLAQLLEFHRRENKAAWWEYFRCKDLRGEELIEDRATLGGLDYEGVVAAERRSLIHRYRFPAQEHGVRAGSQPIDPATGKSAGSVVAIDPAAATIDLKRGSASAAPHPRAVIPFEQVSDTVLRQSIARVADAAIACGLGEDGPSAAAAALLLRTPPRAGQNEGAALARPGETPLEAGLRLVDCLRGGVLPIQGPPGAGKTYTAARMIVHAIAGGKRV